jgi:hypothetical protein
LGQRPGQTDAAIGLAQQRDAAIAGHLPAGETRLDGALFYGWKVEELRVTNCLRRSGVFRIHFNPIDIGSRTPLRPFSRKNPG